MPKKWIITIIFFITAAVAATLICCSKPVIGDAPLTDFIIHASEEELPVSYLETINEKISIQLRSRPAYAGSIVYLTDSFDDDSRFVPFYQLDSFEVSSVFHEGFHAYIDLIIRAGRTSEEEIERFNGIMEDSLDYYTETADGKSIMWKKYRMQVSEEAMAIHITNLVKYKIVYEKAVEKAARNYIYGSIDSHQMEREVLLINRQWSDVIDGKRSRGYYNKSFLRWKLPHIIDAGNYISTEENYFVRDFILPGICSPIDIPPLTEFIKGCKADDLPYDYLIEVNRNRFWDEGMELEPYGEMSPARISQVYVTAFNIYWEKILKRDLGIRVAERQAFQGMLGAARKWYTGPINDPVKIESIIKNAAAEYIKNIIYEKTRWQEEIEGDLLGTEDLDMDKFVRSWSETIEGRNVNGFYIVRGVAINTPKAMTLDEKNFIIRYILPDIDYSFAPLITVSPAAADGEIEAEAGVFTGILGSGDTPTP